VEFLGERGEAVNAANELLGIVNGRQRWEDVFGPSGPSLVASRMHPWVWQPAAKQWDSGHRRDAIPSPSRPAHCHWVDESTLGEVRGGH
jgi:hypothetical protein